jgi:opacity protein-like surface antigen
MKKIVFGVLVALIAVSPAAAAKKSKKAAAAPAKIDSNEASWRLVQGSLPVFLPGWAIPMYLAAQPKK